MKHLIIAAPIEMHRELGQSLLESTHEACLVFELAEPGLQVDERNPT
jgi:hypothetical protein